MRAFLLPSFHHADHPNRAALLDERIAELTDCHSAICNSIYNSLRSLQRKIAEQARDLQ